MKRLIVLFLILALSDMYQLLPSIEAVDIRPPKILSFEHAPQEPPPGYPVNVTALVSSYRPISQVTVSYSNSTHVNQQVAMAFVEGNETLAFFFATLPPNTLGTTVTYKIVANDSSGFRGESSPASFTVREDRIPPDFHEWYVKAHDLSRDFPISEWTEVDVVYNITDSGSGVKEATLRFSNSSDASAPMWNETRMQLSDGDRYNGIWIGVVPAMRNGTIVRYQAEAHDFYGNARNSTDSEYTVTSQPMPSSNIQIVFQDMDLASRNATIYFFFGIHLPLRYPPAPPSLNCWIETDMDVKFYQIPRVSGYWYQGSLTWVTPVYGTTRLYPFDRYGVHLMVRLYSVGLNDSNTRIEPLFDTRVTSTFDGTAIIYPMKTIGGELAISRGMEIHRRPTLFNPVMQAIYAIFFVIGSIAWLPYRREHLAKRLGMLGGLFTSVVVLYFTVYDLLSKLGVTRFTDFPLPLALLTALGWSIAALIAGSLLVCLLLESPGRISYHASSEQRLSSICLALLSVFTAAVFSQGLVFSVPWVCGYVLFALLYAVIGRVAIDALRQRHESAKSLRDLERSL